MVQIDFGEDARNADHFIDHDERVHHCEELPARGLVLAPDHDRHHICGDAAATDTCGFQRLSAAVHAPRRHWPSAAGFRGPENRRGSYSRSAR
jgi:hypothetical protein